MWISNRSMWWKKCFNQGVRKRMNNGDNSMTNEIFCIEMNGHEFYPLVQHEHSDISVVADTEFDDKKQQWNSKCYNIFIIKQKINASECMGQNKKTAKKLKTKNLNK